LESKLDFQILVLSYLKDPWWFDTNVWTMNMVLVKRNIFIVVL